MKHNQTGFCRYCGQAFALESDKELTEEQLNKEATWKCNCEEAIHARAVEEYKKTANTSIDVLFGKEEFCEESAVEFLRSAVPLLAERKILSVTVDLDGRFKAKLTSTVAGKVKVTKTLSERWETED